MTRYRLCMVLIGMFAIGVSAVITPMVGTTYALTAEEMLADPALENRARTLSKQLRCLVCQRFVVMLPDTSKDFLVVKSN